MLLFMEVAEGLGALLLYCSTFIIYYIHSWVPLVGMKKSEVEFIIGRYVSRVGAAPNNTCSERSYMAGISSDLIILTKQGH